MDVPDVIDFGRCFGYSTPSAFCAECVRFSAICYMRLPCRRRGLFLASQWRRDLHTVVCNCAYASLSRNDDVVCSHLDHVLITTMEPELQILYKKIPPPTQPVSWRYRRVNASYFFCSTVLLEETHPRQETSCATCYFRCSLSGVTRETHYSIISHSFRTFISAKKASVSYQAIGTSVTTISVIRSS